MIWHRGFVLSEQQQTQAIATPPTRDALAEAAVAEIQPGMIVGLGTGRAAKRGIRALAERVREEGLEVTCVPTSQGSEKTALELGLTIQEFSLIERIDFLFDGADEVDRELRMLKGSGGAMTRERMVAWASQRCVYLIDESKLVEKLGTNATLPIAVIPFGLASIRAELRNMGLNGVVRRTLDGHLFLTDNANLVIDVTLGDHDPEQVADWLNGIPGVVDHGIFLREADEVLVETQAGTVERLVRQTDGE